MSDFYKEPCRLPRTPGKPPAETRKSSGTREWPAGQIQWKAKGKSDPREAELRKMLLDVY